MHRTTRSRWRQTIVNTTLLFTNIRKISFLNFFHSQTDLLASIASLTSKVYSNEIANSHRNEDSMPKAVVKKRDTNGRAIRVTAEVHDDHYEKYVKLESLFYQNVLKLNPDR